MRVFVTIVAWNGMTFIPELLRSLNAQTFRDFQVLLIDNGSGDGVEAFVRAQHPEVTILRNAHNLGFSPGHNQGIRYAFSKWQGEDLSDRFVLCTNQDTILSPTFLETIVRSAEQHPEAGEIGGKLLRAYSENPQDESLKETVQSDRLDSAGIQPHRNRTFTDRGAGELDRGQYDQEEDVFGFSGALVLLRASALKDVRFEEEVFDQDFFAYKEDIDLAWRLQYRGWKARYVPTAIAYHYRGMYGKEQTGLRELIRNRRKKSRVRSYYCTRNHWNLLMKNERFASACFAFPWIFSMELCRFFYVCLFEPGNARAFLEAVLRAPRMWKKRRHTFRNRKVARVDFREWFI